MKTDTILEFFGVLDPQEVKKGPDNRELFEAEISEVIAEISAHHADSNEYTKAVENLKTLTEAYQMYEHAKAEKHNVSVEYATAKKQERLKMLDTATRCLGISLAAGMTLFWFMVEQERPTPIRLTRMVQDFLTLRV